MINLAKEKYSNTLKIKVSGKMLEATFRTKFTRTHIIPFLTKAAFLGFMLFMSRSSYFMSVILILLGCYILFGDFFTVRRLKIYPYTRAAIPGSGQRIQWPQEYFLRYKTTIDADGKKETIELIAQSEDRTATISIFSFSDEETFEEFRTQFNKAFPEYQIRNDS